METDTKRTARQYAEAICAVWPGWTVTPKREDEDGREWYVYITHPAQGLSLNINTTWKANRLVIHGHYVDVAGNRLSPRDTYALAYNESEPEITVAIDRAPAAIVKDIERRLLPAYTALLIKTREKAQGQCDYRTRQVALITAVAKVLGEEVRGDATRLHDTLSIHLYAKCEDTTFSGTIESSSDNTVKVELRGVNEKTALAIARLIKPVLEDQEATT